MSRSVLASTRPSGRRILLRVPFYKQTAEFSCGPASVAMCLAYFRPRVPLDRDLEFHLWRDTHLPMLYGATRFGIAVAAARNGLGAHIISGCRDLGFAEDAPKFIHIPERGMRFFGIAQWRAASALGVTEEPRDPEVHDIAEVLRAGGLPVLFVSTRLFGDDDIPHWVVVTGFDDGGEEPCFRLNNPLETARRGHRCIPASRLIEHATFFDERGLVALFRTPGQAKRFAKRGRSSRRVKAPPLPKHYMGEEDMEFRSVPGVRIPGIRPSLMDESAEFKRKARAEGKKRAREVLKKFAD